MPRDPKCDRHRSLRGAHVASRIRSSQPNSCWRGWTRSATRRASIYLSVFKALLRALRFLPGIDAIRLLEKHADLFCYVPPEFCLVLCSASKQEAFAGRL
jgi:hypothetical protein